MLEIQCYKGKRSLHWCECSMIREYKDRHTSRPIGITSFSYHRGLLHLLMPSKRVDTWMENSRICENISKAARVTQLHFACLLFPPTFSKFTINDAIWNEVYIMCTTLIIAEMLAMCLNGKCMVIV